MSEQVEAEKSRLLALALVQDPSKGRTVVEWNGGSYEVRAPTMRENQAAERKARDSKTGEVDQYKLSIALVIACTYVPGTEVRIFDEAHAGQLMGQRVTKGGLLSTLSEAIKAAINPDPDAIAKNSEGITGDSASFA